MIKMKYQERESIMEIIAKAVHVIDYEADRIRSINPLKNLRDMSKN